MEKYDKTNTGAIWRNEKKERDTHPDFTGSLDVDGVEYWVNAWKRGPDAKERSPALKFSLKRKEEKKTWADREPGQDDDKGDFPNDDIPF